MEIDVYQIDAFTFRVFSGNPAAVCPLDAWLPDDVLQAIAAENNLAETAYFVDSRGADNEYELRWFTPTVEVDLCGHATLATGHLLLDRLTSGIDSVRFSTRSGILEVTKTGDGLLMSLPSIPADPCDAPPALLDGLGAHPDDTARASNGNYVASFKSEAEVRKLEPDFRILSEIDDGGVIATAPGDEVDFVSRFFAPSFGIDEDPVTGSAHSTLTPYWSAKLGKKRLEARQISARGGEIVCNDVDDRVELTGQCALFLVGRIFVP